MSSEPTEYMEKTHPSILHSKRSRLVKSCFILLLFVSAGSFTTLAYATVVDMQEYYNTSYQSVTIAQMLKSLGVMTATLLSTPINDLFRAKIDLFLFVFGSLFGLTVLAVPWSPHIWVVGVCFYASGLFYSTLNASCVISLTDMWGKRAPILIFGMFSSLSIGNTLAPLVAAPFLSKPRSGNGTDTFDDVSFMDGYHMDEYNMDGYNKLHIDTEYSSNRNMTETRMKIPYALAGGSAILISSAFLVLYLTTQNSMSGGSGRKERTSFKSAVHPGSCANGSVWYGVYCVISLFFIFLCNNARERGYGMFVFTVANQNLHMSKSKSALILLTYNAIGAISRAIFAILSFYVPIQVSVMILIFGSLATHLFAIFFAMESDQAYWVLSCAMSAFINPFRPAITSWMGRYIEVSGFVMSFITIGIGTGGLTGMFMSNYVREHFGAKAVIYLSLGFTVLVTVLFIPLQIVSYIRGVKERTIVNIVINDSRDKASEIDDCDDRNNVNINDKDALLRT